MLKEEKNHIKFSIKTTEGRKQEEKRNKEQLQQTKYGYKDYRD